MAILAQNGDGLGEDSRNKVSQGLKDRSLGGVIMSPLNLIPTSTKNRLARFAAEYPGSIRLADPQIYTLMLDNPKNNKLREYPHFQTVSKDWISNPAKRRGLVEKTLEWQSELDVTAVMSPTVAVDALNEHNDELAFELAEESINRHNVQKPLLINVLISEDVLYDADAVEDWLQKLIELPVRGYYLVVERRAANYAQRFNHVDQLMCLMRICQQLASNNKRVLVGYCDLSTVLLHAVGVDATGTGWWHNLRQFTWDRFTKSDERRQRPNPRYTSRPLLNSISFEMLIRLSAAGKIREVLSQTRYDDQYLGGTIPIPGNWDLNLAIYHHWGVLAHLTNEISGYHQSERLDRVIELIDEAKELRQRIGTALLSDPSTNWDHLDQWGTAIAAFRATYGV